MMKTPYASAAICTAAMTERSKRRLFFFGLKMTSVKSGPSVTSTPTRILSGHWQPIALKYGGGYKTSSITVTTVSAMSTDKPRWIAAAFQRLREVSVILIGSVWTGGILPAAEN